MTTQIIFSLAALSIFVGCHGGVGTMLYSPNPDFPGKCVIGRLLVMSPGEVAKDPYTDCGQIRCVQAGATEFKICPPLEDPPRGYKYGHYVDASQKFPKCCVRKLVKIKG